MRVAGDYFPRRATGLIRDTLDDTRVVVVTGARQVGKSTLAELVLRQYVDGTARFLDDPVTRAAAAEDPVRFVRHDGLMLIDPRPSSSGRSPKARSTELATASSMQSSKPALTCALSPRN
ncbi:MAG: hypothetical protein ACRDRI_13700 [Pseudonocardiaceae bacterium]